ncbi:type II toxin-antitoxin system PemK/MazF family toxin [Planococcus versutus]|uniref:Growth inhibitor PemK n=1 Tax=Planococcus versutus TaxID=1302659 RepID=A0A1B1RXY5_9BACL|nr:type II toxin-antitoxin system PemK/MazF family toxin [Planococcus versutus]ANU25805.1 hypothetical protein I858_001775 [Planococcus versutus]
MTRFFKVGDIIKIDMSPAKGYRPAIVVSEENVHKETDLIWVLLIPNTNKGYPTHVPVNGRTKNNKNSVVNNQTTGYVLCEKIKVIDPLASAARLTDEADQELIEDARLSSMPLLL